MGLPTRLRKTRGKPRPAPARFVLARIRPFGLASAALAATLLSGCGLFPKEKKVTAPVLPEPPALASVYTTAVARAAIVDAIEGFATLTPVRESTLSFKEGGRVKELQVSPGDRVAKGTVLARLDIGDLEYQLALARIDREIAEVTLERMRQLGSDSYAVRIQQLALDKLATTLAYLSSRVDAATIRAPYDGLVTSVLVQVSDRVADYATVIEVSDPSVLELRMNVDVDAVGRIRRGQTAEVRQGEGDWLPVTVSQITHRNPAQDASVQRDEYLVHLALPRRGIDLDEGGRISARIILDRTENALVIPLAGLREFQGRTYVRVLEGDVRREVDVRTGIRTATEVQILEGLAEGDLVIGR